MSNLIDEQIVMHVKLTRGLPIIGHECVEQPHLPCPACTAEADGYLRRKPHPKPETPSEILDNITWYILSVTPEFDTNPDNDPTAKAILLLYQAKLSVRLWWQ